MENNVIGVYEEGNYQAAQSDGEFAELRCYMLAKLLWNPDENIDKLMYDFCYAYYGDGTQYVVDFINFIDENNGGVSIGIDNWWITPFPNEINIDIGMGISTATWDAATLRIKESNIKDVDKMWDSAYNGAKEDWQKDNVKRSEICWRFWKACSSVGEFKNLETRTQMNEELYADFVKFGITHITEDPDCLISENPDLTLQPDKWNR